MSPPENLRGILENHAVLLPSIVPLIYTLNSVALPADVYLIIRLRALSPFTSQALSCSQDGCTGMFRDAVTSRMRQIPGAVHCSLNLDRWKKPDMSRSHMLIA